MSLCSIPFVHFIKSVDLLGISFVFCCYFMFFLEFQYVRYYIYIYTYTYLYGKKVPIVFPVWHGSTLGKWPQSRWRSPCRWLQWCCPRHPKHRCGDAPGARRVQRASGISWDILGYLMIKHDKTIELFEWYEDIGSNSSSHSASWFPEVHCSLFVTMCHCSSLSLI